MSCSLRISCAMTILLVAVALCFPASAPAVSTCKVRVDGRTGNLLVIATGIVGDVRWSGYSDEVGHPFYYSSCIDGDKAKNCMLAYEGSVAARTPPSSCKLWLSDDTTSKCSTLIKHCTPGVRPTEIVLPRDQFLLIPDSERSYYLHCPEGYVAIAGAWDHARQSDGYHTPGVRTYANGNPALGGPSRDFGTWLIGVYNGSGSNIVVSVNATCVRF